MALLIAALLAAACSSNDAIDVTPAKPDDDTGAVAEPGGEDEPASSQPSDDADNNDSDEPDPGTPTDAEPDDGAPSETAPSSANGWTRLSPVADLLHVETTAAGQAIVAGGRGEGLLSVDGARRGQASTGQASCGRRRSSIRAVRCWSWPGSRARPDWKPRHFVPRTAARRGVSCCWKCTPWAGSYSTRSSTRYRDWVCTRAPTAW